MQVLGRIPTEDGANTQFDRVDQPQGVEAVRDKSGPGP